MQSYGTASAIIILDRELNADAVLHPQRHGYMSPAVKEQGPLPPQPNTAKPSQQLLYCVFFPSPGSEFRAAVGALLRISSDGRADDIASVGARAGLDVEDTPVGTLVDDLLREADADVLWPPMSQ